MSKRRSAEQIAEHIGEKTNGGEDIIRGYMKILSDGESTPADRQRALDALASRMWGKPAETLTVSRNGSLPSYTPEQWDKIDALTRTPEGRRLLASMSVETEKK